jgi:hypothetical protein
MLRARVLPPGGGITGRETMAGTPSIGRHGPIVDVQPSAPIAEIMS